MTDPGAELRFERRRFHELGVDTLYELLRLRGDVFVVEQECHVENEVDGRDPDALHILGRNAAGALVAAARVHDGAAAPTEEAVVSRILVRQDNRKAGVGSALMGEVHGVLGARRATMSAQARLETWYGRLGWTRVGGVYDDAGIPHVRMVRT